MKTVSCIQQLATTSLPSLHICLSLVRTFLSDHCLMITTVERNFSLRWRNESICKPLGQCWIVLCRDPVSVIQAMPWSILSPQFLMFSVIGSQIRKQCALCGCFISYLKAWNASWILLKLASLSNSSVVKKIMFSHYCLQRKFQRSHKINYDEVCWHFIMFSISPWLINIWQLVSMNAFVMVNSMYSKNTEARCFSKSEERKIRLK